MQICFALFSISHSFFIETLRPMVLLLGDKSGAKFCCRVACMGFFVYLCADYGMAVDAMPDFMSAEIRIS